jgi:mannosylglucosylglycerate synthase
MSGDVTAIRRRFDGDPTAIRRRSRRIGGDSAEDRRLGGVSSATAAFVSFRLGLTDGVSTVAVTWQAVFEELGFRTFGVAGEGPVDRLVPGLAMGATTPPTASELRDALRDADLVVVENLLTIPLNLPTSRAVADVLRGRPALLHHHDPPWQRTRFAHITELPASDPAWRHVAITRLTAAELGERGIVAATIYNAFDTDEPPGDGRALRGRLDVEDGRPLLLHPVRAIERKDVPAALRLAEAVRGTYWLSGPAEEGYGPVLDRLLRATSAPIRHRPFDHAEIADAYAAADAILYPSTWEGFGNPPIEAAIFRRPAAVGGYPVAEELRALGFRWLPTDDPDPLRRALLDPALQLEDLEHNQEVARRHFSRPQLVDALRSLLDGAGWLP